jgi:phosphoglycolate phosphatase
VNSAPFRLVVFDLDGTLVDSRRDLAESANAVLESYGCPPHSEEAIGRMVGDGAATLVRRAFEAAGCPQPVDALDRFLATYNSRLLKFTRPYGGIPEVLAALAPRTILAVCTNKPMAPTRTILEQLELAGYFAGRIVGGDGPLPRKPDPAGLRSLMAAADAGPAATVLIGDSVIDWQTAEAASTAVCMAGYGFGFEGFPRERLRSGDQVAERPADLMQILY